MPAKLDNLTVLVLDDHRFMQHVLRLILQGLGVRNIVSAEGCDEAIRRLANDHYDLIITDYRLDGPNGADFTRLVRAAHEGVDRFVPIIACTADTTAEVIRDLRDAGADEVLGKPVSAERLWMKITAVVNARRKFVAAPDFFGPDRRRRAAPRKGEERRSGR